MVLLPSAGAMRRYKLDAVSKALVKVLGGSRGHDERLKYLTNGAADGKLVLHEDGQEITDPERIKNALQAAIQESLTQLSYSALLVG